MAWPGRDLPAQTGRVAVVTGGDGGLGFETVRELARKGARVVMAAHNLDEVARAHAAVTAELPGASIEVRALDVGSLASVQAFAAEVLRAHDAIDLLFANAGVMAMPEGTTVDGFETQSGTDHLGHFELRAFAAARRAPRGCRQGGDDDLDRPLRGRPERRGRPPPSSPALRAVGGVRLCQAREPAVRARTRPASARRRFEGYGALGRPGFGLHRPAADDGTLDRPRWIAVGPPVVGGIGLTRRKPEDLAPLWSVSEQDVGERFDVADLVSAG